MSLALGTACAMISIHRLEAGSDQANGNAVANRAVVTAENGNMYTVSISDDGMFSAEFVQPPALSIPLGTSGSSVEVRRNEDLTFSAMIDGEWMVITADTTVTAANGNVYAAQLSPEGVPIGVMHVAAMQDVMLGALGGTVKLTQAEDMTWWYGETEVKDGYVHTAENGNMYVLMMDAEGMWSAMYQKVMVNVALGAHGGSIELVRAENMSWWYGDVEVVVGSEVTAANGNLYTLWYSTDDGWTTRYEPAMMEIEGTGLVALAKEDGTGYDVDGAMLPASGMGDIDTSAGTYRVVMMDGMLAGTRLDNVAIDGDTDFVTAGIHDGKLKAVFPTIPGDEDDTEDVNEAKTMLKVGGDLYSFGDLLGDGMATGTGDNFVAKAKEELEGIRAQIAAVIEVFDVDSERDTQITRLWGTAADAGTNRTKNVRKTIGMVFANNDEVIASAPDDDEALGKIDDLIDALSSLDGLATALEDGGVFEEGNANGMTAEEIFDATSVESSVSYGLTGMTRYGALSKKERERATAKAVYKYDGELDDDDNGTNAATENENVGQLGAFAFGVTAETARARHVQSAGNAFYDGETLAVDKDGTHYSGDIGIRVRFATEKVDGLITNLISTDGEPWTYLYGDVESIVLPTADMAATGIWKVPTANNDASITFALRAGSPGPQMIDSTFNGRLLGTGDNAGYQSVGTWSVGADPSAASYIAGGFGAERVADEPDFRPDPGDGIEAVLMSTSTAATTQNTAVEGTPERVTGGGLTVLEDGMLKITVAKFGWERTGALGDDASTYTRGRLAADLNEDGDTADTALAEGAPDNVGDLNLDGDTGDTIDEADAATRTYEISLSSLLAKEGAEFNFNGGVYVTMAREMIQAERNKLAVLIDSDQLASEQANIWQKIQEILLVYVFKADAPRSTATDDVGKGFAGRLPTQVSGNYDKSTALDRVDRIIDALSSSSNLEEALDPDEDGLFIEDDGDPFAGRASGDIWGEKDSQVKAWVGTTDYTRFGVWRVRRSRNALRGLIQGASGTTVGNQAWENAEREAFAYSPLPKSEVDSATSPNYPNGASATYEGKTVAFVDTFVATGAKAGAINGASGYEGAVDVHVEWGVDAAGVDLAGDPTPIGGRITVVLSGLQNANGDDLTHGATPRAVREIVFPYLAFTTGTDNVLDFASTSAQSLSIRYMDLNVTPDTTETANLSGTFVGASADGPLGVIGLYDITGFTIGTNDANIDGAFGADLP